MAFSEDTAVSKEAKGYSIFATSTGNILIYSNPAFFCKLLGAVPEELAATLISRSFSLFAFNS